MKSSFSLSNRLTFTVLFLIVVSCLYYLYVIGKIPFSQNPLLEGSPVQGDDWLIHRIWTKSPTLIDAELDTLTYLVTTDQISNISNLQQFEELCRQVFLNIKAHYEAQGEIEKVAKWIKKIPSNSATRLQADNWFVGEELRWKSNTYHENEAQKALEEGRFEDASEHLSLIENSSEYWQQRVNSLNVSMVQRKAVACTQNSDQNWQVNTTSMSLLNSFVNQNYRAMCEQPAPSLP